MLANELIAKLQKTFYKNNFAGIYASDKIPKTIKNKHFIILNTDPSSQPGRHWYAIVRINNVLECFDSLGNSNDQKLLITNRLNIKGVSFIQFNITQLQPTSSILCGQFVLYYLFERYHNLDLDFDELLNEIFTDDLQKNEETVLNFISQNLTSDS